MTGARNRPTIALLCSPHLGILDNWLPVLHELRRRHPHSPFVIVVPDAGITRSIAADDALVAVAGEVFDRWILRMHSGRWVAAERMLDTGAARAHARIHASVDRVNRWAARRGRLARAAASQVVRIARQGVGSRAFDGVLARLDGLRRRHRAYSLPRLGDRHTVLCYCLSSEVKDSLRDLLDTLRDAPRFSIYHGGINTVVPASRRADRRLVDLDVRSFLVAESERQALADRFGLRDEAMRTVGIVRHDPRWMATVRGVSASRHTVPFRHHVLLASRPVDPRGLPRERKVRALRDLKEIVIDGLGLPVLVKTHPKQDHEGLYEEAFGLAGYGRTWAYTRAHPYQLAKGCEFAVSFGSAIDVDMVACGVPAIDRRDRRGLANYDTPEATRDAQGRILDGFATVGMVLVAETTEDFRAHVDEIVRDRTGVVGRLQAAYREVFGVASDPVTQVADEISGSIEQLAARS